ncbi:malonate decarboxylase holo-ACP synthase [Pseudomonas huanghezhanensis]|uniref:malonate decarboxylase holo-ACP synthase n=1 Tax=Pseudomonas huanghezhanensis TaxID=3002903 RepID=UPI002285BE7C|nr:malonate decarboxylase holo-ACP synthase [Pseudomonas sp. BSw22131]
MNARVAVRPHDLLWGLPLSALAEDAPSWCVEVVSLGHPVVVRRARVDAGYVAVGLRGQSRDQRYAAVMALREVQRVVEPEQLAACMSHSSASDWPALSTLRRIRPLMDSLGLPWGVVGSAGFELASGIAVLRQQSDLDLILRTSRFMDRTTAAQLIEALDEASCRIDLQLQTPSGAVALREWAGQSRQVLLKSEDGARLVENPWRVLESVG